jgi:hypothetical protein
MLDKLKTHSGVLQFSTKGETLSIQVESEGVVPNITRYIVECGGSILRVNPRDYTLEDIYFSLQTGEA